jgi:probable rRNA maturation factor
VKRPAPARPPAPAGELLIRNRQRARRVALRPLRELTLAALAAQPELRTFELGIHLVAATEMAAVNETFLDHAGSTDVITFDHSNAERGMRNAERLHGELFICLDDAVKQAREFGTSWPAELARYVIHGILHLRGFDDITASARRRMKREEDRLLHELARRHPLGRLEKRGTAKRE